MNCTPSVSSKTLDLYETGKGMSSTRAITLAKRVRLQPLREASCDQDDSSRTFGRPRNSVKCVGRNRKLLQNFRRMRVTFVTAPAPPSLYDP